MRIELIDSLLAIRQKLGIRWVLLSGGEAMQHPEWHIIAQRFRDAGVYVMLLTNGLLIRRQQDLIPPAVDELIVSLDAGTAATYAAIRGVDAFDLIMDGIRDLVDAGVPVVTRTTVQRANYAELPALIDAAYAAGVSRISFLPVDVSSEIAFGTRLTSPLMLSDEQRTALTPDEIDEFSGIIRKMEQDYAALFAQQVIAESPDKLRRMIHYFRSLNAPANDYPPPRCNAPHISVVVEVDGTVRPCYFLPSMGNLNANTMLEVLNSPEALALRQSYQRGERTECERCVCPLYKGPRALLRM